MKKIIGFVDDKRQYTNDWKSKLLLTVANKLQLVTQNWDRLLYTSGGKLELSKCAWYCISWKFNPGVTPKIFNNTSYEIALIDSATTLPHAITELIVHSPLKYLESESTPLGTTKCQLLTINNHGLRGTRIISSNKTYRYHISLYLKIHLHPKLISP